MQYGSMESALTLIIGFFIGAVFAYGLLRRSRRRAEDALRAVSEGNARLYFTPKDANLSIESHDHAHDAPMAGINAIGMRRRGMSDERTARLPERSMG